MTPEAAFRALRDLWMQPVPANSFYINGFPDRLAQLADLYDEDVADEMRRIFEAVPAEGATAHNAAYRRTWMAAPRLIYPEQPRGETA